MRKKEDIDITGLIKEKANAPLGDAHELLVRSIMMRLGIEVGKVDLSSGPYDLMIAVTDKPGGVKTLKRAQVKTVEKNLHLTAGSRGGVDRIYKSGVKTYKYTTVHNDVIFGVDKATLDIYVVPTMLCDLWGTSVSKNKITKLKNNWDILINWNEDFLSNLRSSI